jgi:rhodanese-related sulfurtransferase
MKSIDAPALAQWMTDSQRSPPQVLDVREPWELAICRIEGSDSIPLRALPAELPRLDDGRPVVCVCHHGGRSAHAAMFLARQGFDVYNLIGGIDAWARQVDATMPKY